MPSDQFLNEQEKKVFLGILGFGVPAALVLAQVIFDFGSLPLMILAISWFGIALLILLGLSEE